ncbi:MAG TPA: beta-propeller domain-containing protein [Solirubrobacteraceae bacterium]
MAAVGLGVTAPAQAAPSTLPAFGSCASLLKFAKAGAHRTNGQPGVTPRAVGPPPPVLVTPSVAPTSAPGTPLPAAAKEDSAASTAFSTTNNQEVDVDEPDLVKTDGTFVYAVADNTLRIVDVTATPKVVGELKLDGYGHQLLLRKDTLLVVATQSSYYRPVGGGPTADIAIAPYPGAGKTIVTEISIADRAKPTVKRTMTIDGDYVDARQNGGTARIVIDSAPDRIVPAEGETIDEAIDDARTKTFLGGTVLKSKVSGKTYRRQLVKCNQVRHPRSFSGLDVLTIMTVDLDKGLYSLDRDAVMAGAQVVYGSTNSLYVASQRYSRAVENGTGAPEGLRTEIHRFSVADSEKTVYRASGSVRGFALNQYAFSEHEGDLRVATTEQPEWFEGKQVGEQHSGITVLRQDGSRLEQIGRISGLGKDERIYAVRFIGDRGYVVTFRQIDPLFVVDLSKPTEPRLRGELEIPGYSAYLHPVGDGRLLGVGQEATAQGRVTGAQVSLFDVSDPAKPTRVSQLKFANGRFGVEDEPHAFLYWDPTKLAVLPVSLYGDKGESFGGAIGVRVGTTLTETGRVEHQQRAGEPQDYKPPVSRALVVGDKLYTLSYAGLVVSRLDNLGPLGYVAFKK